MLGTVLGDIRDHIDALASDEGEYFLVCGRYGDQLSRPQTFASRATRPHARLPITNAIDRVDEIRSDFC